MLHGTFFDRSWTDNIDVYIHSDNMTNIMADEYPPFSLDKPRYNQVSCC